MFDLESALRRVIEIDGSDLHLKVPSRPLIRHLGHLEPIPDTEELKPQDTEGALTERLLAALDAAEAVGGDIRGRQSGAILVVPAVGKSWETTIDLRVEDHEDPLVELHRLVRLHDAYGLAAQADELIAQGRTPGEAVARIGDWLK